LPNFSPRAKDWLLRDDAAFNTPGPITGSHSYLWKTINDELNNFHSITHVALMLFMSVETAMLLSVGMKTDWISANNVFSIF
jgi:hypothetical protein